MPKLVAAALAAATLLAGPAAHAAEGRLPAFLAETGAQTLSIDEMEAVRGEALPAVLVAFAARRVGTAVGLWAGVKIADMLRGNRVPTYTEYSAAFGKNTARVLSVLPAPLKPRMAR